MIIELTNREELDLWRSSVIYTVTYMSGDPTKAASYLKSRICKIVACNPWLGSWPSVLHGHKVLVYHFEPSETAEKCFEFYDTEGNNDDDELERLLDTFYSSPSLEELARSIRGHSSLLVKPNSDLLLLEQQKQQHEPMWRVCIIPVDNERSAFLLVVSMSHVLGNMLTFHKVFHMLSSSKPIESLNRRRGALEESDEWRQDVFDKETFRESLQKVLRAPPIEKRSIVFRLSQNWIKRQKQRALVDTMDSEAFVSTNDVLTSWFFRHTRCDLGVLVWDPRHRINSSSDNFFVAGNCTRYSTLAPEEYASPLTVRQSLSLLPWPPDTDSSLPTIISSDETAIIASVNNLIAGDRDDVLISDCKPIWQFPLFFYDMRTSSRIFQMLVFKCGPRMQVGVRVTASEYAIHQIEDSGMIDSILELSC